jgi:integrase
MKPFYFFGGINMIKKLPKTISEQEFINGLKNVKSLKHKAAYVLAFYQCMRISEVVNLNLDNIDKDRGFIHIIQAKGNKDRDVPIMKPVYSALKHLPIGVGSRALEIACKKVWPELHFHCLRHSGATMYLNDKKVDIRHIQQLLGHSRLDTTMIYTHVTPSNQKVVFDEVWK